MTFCFFDNGKGCPLHWLGSRKIFIRIQYFVCEGSFVQITIYFENVISVSSWKEIILYQLMKMCRLIPFAIRGRFWLSFFEKHMRRTSEKMCHFIKNSFLWTRRYKKLLCHSWKTFRRPTSNIKLSKKIKLKHYKAKNVIPRKLSFLLNNEIGNVSIYQGKSLENSNFFHYEWVCS